MPDVFVSVFVLGAFSSFSPATQWLALEWMVVTYDLLASTSKVREPTTSHPLECAPQFAKQQLVVSPRMQPHQVHSLYGVLFHWIEYETLRPLLCNLLYRMTRPQDVLTWRVHKLYPLSHPS